MEVRSDKREDVECPAAEYAKMRGGGEVREDGGGPFDAE